MKIIYCPSLHIFHVVCENCQNYIYGPSSCLLLIPFKPTHCSAVIDRDAWKTLRPHWSQHELHRNEHVFSHKITQVFEAVSFDSNNLCRSRHIFLWSLYKFHANVLRVNLFELLQEFFDIFITISNIWVEALKALQLKSLPRISWVFAKFEVAWIKNRSKTWKLLSECSSGLCWKMFAKSSQVNE